MANPGAASTAISATTTPIPRSILAVRVIREAAGTERGAGVGGS
jgi:hypothetical protein